MLGFVDDVWAYDFFSLISGFFLKNFEILTAFLRDFAGIEGAEQRLLQICLFLYCFVE